MTNATTSSRRAGLLMSAILAAAAIVIFAFTWISIERSRDDAFSLMVRQSISFAEALAQTAESAIAAETFYEFLLRQRFHDIATSVLTEAPHDPALFGQSNLDLAHTFGMIDIFRYSGDSLRNIDTALVDSVAWGIPVYVLGDAIEMALHPRNQSLLLFDPGEPIGQDRHYYLEITNDLREVIVLVADASFYSDALQLTQIGYLAQKLSTEAGIVYIMYQTPEGIVFSSRRPGSTLAIDSDPFLADALDADSASWREYEFQTETVLEVARPFAGGKYTSGLLRIGFSMAGYDDAVEGYDTQIVIFAIVLFALIVTAIVYLHSRRRHAEIMQEYAVAAQRRERLSEMGNLAAGVAHEIRNPLNTISIAAQRLASEFKPSDNEEEFARFTGQIRQETKRLNDIITRFLALSRQQEKRRQAVRLDELLRDIAALQSEEARRIGITYTLDVSDPITVSAEPDRLRQVFANLYNNAKEAMGEKGGTFNIAITSDSERVIVSVSDSGPGVSEELRSKIFAPYMTTKESGTGLGLATVHAIITEMGGQIRCEKSTWGGAAFIITFPRADQ